MAAGKTGGRFLWARAGCANPLSGNSAVEALAAGELGPPARKLSVRVLSIPK